MDGRALDESINSVVTWIDDASVGAGSLAGMRVGVKDNIDVAGVRGTRASRFFADRVAEHDADVVARLRGAGASIVATLNMAEFAVGVTSQYSAAGPVRNPWDPSRVPGGSSGGSGAAVAAGLVDAALGTDTGGSVRLPASACGVVGLRPTVGTISNSGVFPVSDDYDTVGPLARSVTDVARMFDVLSQSSPRPGASVRRIGVPRTFVTDDVPGAADAQDVVYTMLYSDLARLHRDRLRDRPELFQPETLARMRLGLAITDGERADAVTRRDLYRQGLVPLFDSVDVVLTPAMPVDVPPIDGGDGVVAQSRRVGQFTYPWSLHDGPTLALPVGFHPESRMPVGVQLTAAAHGERRLFEVGDRYQSATNWHRVRPPVCVDGPLCDDGSSPTRGG